MLRLITQYVEKPAFLVLCDHPECGNILSAEAEVSDLNMVPINQQELAFLQAAANQGWLVTMRATYCPPHTAAMRDRAKENNRPQLVV
jgi:hypothetical protein